MNTPESESPLTRAVDEKIEIKNRILGFALNKQSSLADLDQMADEIFNRIHTLGIQEGRELERAEQSIAYKKSGV